MTENKGLHLLYKNLGETPNERILRYKEAFPEYENASMTYAGRLDPMAEGLLLVLSGEEIKNKEKYQNLDKTYEAQILWGFETDSLDVLGLVSEERDKFPTIGEVKNFLEKSVGAFRQEYPAFSSKPVNGKPLFEWAREGKTHEIEIPKHQVELYEALFKERRFIRKEELLVNLKFKIQSVRGDFRQKIIWEKWLSLLQVSKNDIFVVDTLRLRVSSGFYIRQFVKDVSHELNSRAVAFHIKRTQIGEFSIA